jgi:multidrug efflux pump
VRIRDLGRVEIGAASERSSVRFNGAGGGARRHQAGDGQPARALEGAARRVAQGEANCPRACGDIAYDSSVFIDRSIEAVFTTIGEAMLLVLAIIFFFLRNCGRR